MKLFLSLLLLFTSKLAFTHEAASIPADIKEWMSTQLQYEDDELFSKSTCRLPGHETIRVGCTHHCGFWERWALFRYANRMGYRLEIVSLFENKMTDLNNIDAILIPGGPDINPAYYIDHVEPELQEHLRELDYLVDYTYEGLERDSFEHQLLQDYFEEEAHRHTPILGICRGMQMLAVSQKVPLYIDLREELGIKNRRWKIDRVSTQKDSLAQKLYTSSARGVKYHHQGIRVDYFEKFHERWPHLNISAQSFRGKIAEALEFTGRPVFGVQFHPEWTLGRVRAQTFRWFLNQACEKKYQTL